MEYNATQTEIARQIHITKPDAYVPGVDVAMRPDNDPNTIEVLVLKTGLSAVIRYDAGPDTYTVTTTEDGITRDLTGVYCDQLGELVFGAENAKPFSEPMVEVITDEDDPRFREFFGC